MIRLYHAPRTRSVRVIWACEELGVPYEIVSVPFGAEKPAELVAKNPGATLPLMTKGDVVLFESVTMMEYVAESHGPTDLVVGPDEPGHWDYRQMLLWGEATLAAPINFLVGTVFRGPEDQHGNFTAELVRSTFERRLRVVSQRLETSDYVVGDRFTLADISVAYALQLAKDVEPLGLKAMIPDPVFDYMRRLADRPAFQRMTKVR